MGQTAIMGSSNASATRWAIVAGDSEFVVASPDVLDEGVAGGHDHEAPG
jgi:hypothetical protein